jgi:hypothetical protein
MDLEHLRRLAGINNQTEHTPSVGENVSYSATEKAEYQRKHRIQPGTQEWFNYGLRDPISLVRTQCLVKNS